MPRDIGGFPVPNSIVACLGEKRAADIFAFNDFLDEKFDLSRFRFNLLEEFMKILDLKVTYPIFKKYFSSEQGRELQDGEVIRLLCSQGQNNLAEDITWLKRVFTPKGNQSYVTPSHLVRKKEPVSGKVGSTDEPSTSAKASPKPTTSARKPAKSTQSLIPEKKNLSLILSERRSNPDRKCKPAKSTQSLIPEKKNLSLILSERRSNPDRKVKLISPHQKTEKDKLPVGSSKSKDKVVPSRTRRKDLEMQKKLQITSAEFVDGDSSDEDIIPSTQATGAQSPAIHETPNVQKKFVKAKIGNSSDNKDSETLDDELAEVKNEKSPSSQRDGCKQLQPADLNKRSDPKNSSDKNERTKAADSSDESKSSDSDGDLRASNAPDKVPSRTTNERLSPTKTSPIKPNSIKNVPADSSDESKSSDSDGDLLASNAPDKVPSRMTNERLSPSKISPIKPNSIKNEPKPPRPRNHSVSDDSDSGESDDGCRGITQNAQDVTALACSPKPAGKRPSCVLGELDDPPGEENGSQIVGSRKRKASDTSIQLPKSKEPKMSFPAAGDAKKMSGTSDSESDSDESDSAHREAPTKLPEANCSVGSKIETNADTPIGEMAASTKKVHPFDSTRLPGDLDASFPGNDISVIRQCSTPPTAVSKGSKNAKTKPPLTPVNQRSILEFAKPTPPTRVPADDEYAEMKDHYIRLGFTDLNDDFDFESNLATFAEDLLDDDSEVYLLQCPEEVDGSTFLGQRLEIDTRETKITTLKDGKSYETNCDAYDPNRISNMIFPSRRMKRFSFSVVPILGKITVSEAVPVPKVPDFDVTPSTPVPFPTNLKARNSLASSCSSVISDTSSQSSSRLVSKKPKVPSGEAVSVKTPDKSSCKEEDSQKILSDSDRELGSKKKKKKKDKDKKLDACVDPTAVALPILTQPFPEQDVLKKKKKKKDVSFDDDAHQDIKQQQLIDKVALILDADQGFGKKKKKRKQEQTKEELTVDLISMAIDTEAEEKSKKKKKKKHLEEVEEEPPVIQETTPVNTELEEIVRKKKKKKKHQEEEQEGPVTVEEPVVPDQLHSEADPTVHKKKKKKEKHTQLKAEISEDIDAVNSHKTPSADIRDDKEQLLIDRVFSNLEPESEEVPSKKKKKKKHQEVVPDEIHEPLDEKKQLLIDRVLETLETDLEVPKKKKKKKKHQEELSEDVPAEVPLKTKKSKKVKTESQF